MNDCEGPKLNAAQKELVRCASSAAARASVDDTLALAEAYKKSRVNCPPGRPEAAFGGALLAMRFLRVAAYEGHPERRDAVWKELVPVATLFGLDRREIALLTSAEDDLRRILGPYCEELV
ncbi:hypothetical protein [Sinomonas sp. P10A9]|uniref:Uncharacterized protein n=1 Tax=Sinomonas puerhi TaxID=3238584 RepID=A0AB39L223_9MICC